MQSGERFRYVHVFSNDEVRGFAELSGDRGRQHVEADVEGRLMVHGLLTLGLATKIGAQWSYLLQHLEVEFLRPVYTGERVSCEVLIGDVVQEEGRRSVASTVVCKNSRGKEVLRATTKGFVLDENAT